MLARIWMNESSVWNHSRENSDEDDRNRVVEFENKVHI